MAGLFGRIPGLAIRPPRFLPGATDFWLHVANWKPAAAGREMIGFTALSRSPGMDNVAGVYYPG